jgi:NaMN:DMB phosphoribosyltransferase
MDVCIFSHASSAPAHVALLRSLNVFPMLAAPIAEEGGYGAAMALHLLDITLRLLTGLSSAATLE